MPFGFVVASVGRQELQGGWLGVEQVMEFRFWVRRRDVQTAAT
jgi:hypothetical protein